MTITSKLNCRYFLIAAAKYWTKLMEFIWNLWSSQYVLPCSVVTAQRPGEWYKVCPFLRWSFLGSRANISGMQCWPIRAYICLIYLERLNIFSRMLWLECYVDFQAVDVPLLESVVKLTKDADDSEEEDEFGYTKSREH